jgi:hypothetical protein
MRDRRLSRIESKGGRGAFRFSLIGMATLIAGGINALGDEGAGISVPGVTLVSEMLIGNLRLLPRPLSLMDAHFNMGIITQRLKKQSPLGDTQSGPPPRDEEGCHAA